MGARPCQHAAMDQALTLRATAESGDTIDDPSEDALFMMFEDIEAGESSFLIVDRLADTTGQTYVQTSRNSDGSYTVEYREGGPEHHYRTVANDMRSAHSLVTGWAFEPPGWRESAGWRNVGRTLVLTRHKRRIVQGALVTAGQVRNVCGRSEEIMSERLNPAGRLAVVHAQEQASAFGDTEIMPEHVLLGVIADVDGVGGRVLRRLGVDRAQVVVHMAATKRQTAAAVRSGAWDWRHRWHKALIRSRLVGGALPVADSAKRALERSEREALALGHDRIGTGHILIGLFADEHSPLLRGLRRQGLPLDPGEVRARVLEELRLGS